MTRLTHGHDDFSDLAMHVGQLTAQLPGLHAELRARWQMAKRDGYPPASMRDGSPPSHEVDPITGVSIPLPVYADPTGDTATEDPTRDQDAITMVNAYRLLRDADALLRSAHGQMTKALRPPPEVEDELDDPGCQSCRRLRSKADPNRRVWEPTHNGQLCRWCSGWNAEAGSWPAMDVLRDHHDGKRIGAERMPQKSEIPCQTP